MCLVAQSCPTLCDPLDCSPPGSSVNGIFFRQEYWNGLPFPPPGDLPNPEIKPTSLVSPTLQADSVPTDQSQVNPCESLRESNGPLLIQYTKENSR